MKTTRHLLDTTVTSRVNLRYLISLPKGYQNKGPKKTPLLLFLHGAGERGDDLKLVKKHGPPRLIEEGRSFPFVVVSPQCPSGQWWKMDPLRALLDHILACHNVDRSRLYLTGLSMGGYGTWALADACPGVFAAIAPICGPFVYLNSEHFKDLPVWCFHGAMDPVVPVGDSVRMVRTIREAGANVRFTVYPDAAHDSWSEPYSKPELYRWLLAHRRRAGGTIRSPRD